MKQITIILPHPTRAIANITTLLGKANINIETIEAEDVSGQGIIQLTVDQYNLAIETLREADYPAVADDAFVIRVDDKPGALAQIAERFSNANINIRSMRIVAREQGSSLVAIVADDNALAETEVGDLLVTT